MEIYKDTKTMDWKTGRIKGFSAKNLIELEKGSFKIVKVEALSAYPMHQHSDKTEYVYVLKGTPTITVEETTITGKKDDFFISPTKKQHCIENKTTEECILLIGAIKN